MPSAAKAKSTPKSAPSALNAATDALESAVGQLHAARSKEATWDLLMQVRRLHHMAAIFSQWAQDQNSIIPLPIRIPIRTGGGPTMSTG
jgi:hypothetical protein